MLFDGTKGVRKKCLPDPNPQKVSLSRSATLDIVFSKARELYFEEFNVSQEAMSLCDSSGIIIPADNEWSLGQFYNVNGLQPSRYKLYVVAKLVRYAYIHN